MEKLKVEKCIGRRVAVLPSPLKKIQGAAPPSRSGFSSCRLHVGGSQKFPKG